MGKGMGVGMGTRIRVVAALLAALPALASAQEEACREAERVGSLGITGIECDRCQFITSGGHERAVFYTEPVILALRSTAPAADILRPEDVLVAIDGRLITTSDGWNRFSNLPAGGEVTLRIRRQGREREVRVPLVSVCPSDEAAVLAGRPVPEPPTVGVGVPRAPTAPSPNTEVEAVAESLARLFELPAPPSPASIAPRAFLGFGFQCTECGYDGTAWRFSEPPVVQGLAQGLGAAQDGLRQGDRLVEIDGVDITSDAGGRAFAAIEPGDRIAWTVVRDGRVRTVHTVAQERRSAYGVAESTPEAPAVGRAPAALPSLAGAAERRLPIRFTGSVGNVTVEVRGGQVTVTETDDGRLIVIRTGDSEIRIQAPSREGIR